MDSNIDVDFSEDFLLEVDAAEAAALRSRSSKRTFCGRDHASIRLQNLNESPASLHAMSSTQQSQACPMQQPRCKIHGDGDDIRQSGERSTFVNCGNGPDCNEGSRCDFCAPNRAAHPMENDTSVKCDDRGDDGLGSYRWRVDRISIRDGTRGWEEDVGQGELMVNAHQQADGTLTMLNAVVTATGGGRAMDIPRDAMAFLARASREKPDSAPGATPVAVPTVLLGLKVGCIIVMRGIARATATLDSRSGTQETMPHEGAIKSLSALSCATPERRQLAPSEFLTPSSAGENDHTVGYEAEASSASGALISEGLSRKANLDALMETLINASHGQLNKGNGMTHTSETTGCESQSLCRHSSPEDRAPGVEGQASHKNTDREWREITATSGASTDTRPPRTEVGNASQAEAGVDASNASSIKKGFVVSEQEVDVPEDEWRRPLSPSDQNRRRAVAGRRKPTARGIPRTGPVVLALSDPVEGSNRLVPQTNGVRSVAGDITRETGRKRRRPDPVSERSQSLPPGDAKLERTESSWLVLRKTLHERYQEFEERGAAEEAAVEASRKTGVNGSTGGTGGGEMLFPGLRVFRRQEHAFTYADALQARLAPHDAARYKVLSFETNSSGSRKFLVCDFRRFEEQYPYVTRPDQDILQQLTGTPRFSQDVRHSTDQGVEYDHSCARRKTPLQTAADNVKNLQSAKASIAAAASPKGTSSPLRHVYEIIREGSACRMYFDLEFTRGCNPGLDGEELVRAWINVVAGKLQQDFGISVGVSNFLDLDSSTPKKFSRHVILHLPRDQLFENNSHVGRFVNGLAADLEAFKPLPTLSVNLPPSPPTSSTNERPIVAPISSKASRLEKYSQNGYDREAANQTPPMLQQAANPPVLFRSPEEVGNINSTIGSITTAESESAADGEPCAASVEDDVMVPDSVHSVAGKGSQQAGALEQLWVCDGDGRRVLFADVSVYTRNRCFRLVGSSKFGKDATLRIADANERSLEHMKRNRVQNRGARGAALTVLHDSLVVPMDVSSSESGNERHIFLTVEGGGGPHRYTRLGQTRRTPARSSEFSSASGNPRQSLSCTGGADSAGNEQQGWRVTDSGFGLSPFPTVDGFLRTLICRGGVTGDLRQWSYGATEQPKAEKGGESQDRQNVEGSGSARSVRRLLTHQVANNRWCANIVRAHKSNHIFLVTDLSRGEVRQHCHDQDCRRAGYRSPPVRLPPAVIPSPDDLDAYDLDLGLKVAMRDSPREWAAVA